MIEARDRSLDGLRGIAAFAVVVSHVAAMTWNPFYDKGADPAVWQKMLWHLGAPAVDVFLVLSGYVVAGALIRSRAGYGEYLLGRMARLYPVAWLAVLAGLALRVADLRIPGAMSAATVLIRDPLGASDMIGFATMIAPIPTVNSVNPPLWTLVLEMQAALIMPLLAWGARRDARILALLSLAVPTLAASLIGYAYPYYFTGFGIGAALVVFERRVPQAPRPAVVLIFFGAILLCRHFLDSEDAGLRVPCALAAAGVVLAIRQGAAHALLRSRVCSWLGDVSYPLYAIHWPVMAAFCMILGTRIGITAAAVISIPLSVALAWVVSRAVDRPAIALSRTLRGKA
jgi:peptidoglycan/LPS O-acetylase OafA/YrhL